MPDSLRGYFMNKKKNTGKEYEEFVRNLQQAIFDSEKLFEQRNIVVEKNKIIKDKNGIDREFDLYWEYELGGFVYKTVIECKDYNCSIKLTHIDALLGKIKDIPELKAAFATKIGYQPNAEKKAKSNAIDLLIVRKQNDSDWRDENGNFLTKIMDITINSYIPARITRFDILFDEKWVKENRPDIDISKPFQMGGFDKDLFIDDIANNEKYSLYDFSLKLTALEDNKPGDYEKMKKFTNAYISHKENKIKVSLIKVFFNIQEPIESKIIIDYSQELLGVIEYLNKGIKKKVFENGNIQQGKLNLGNQKPKKLLS